MLLYDFFKYYFFVLIYILLNYYGINYYYFATSFFLFILLFIYFTINSFDNAVLVLILVCLVIFNLLLYIFAFNSVLTLVKIRPPDVINIENNNNNSVFLISLKIIGLLEIIKYIGFITCLLNYYKR